MTNSGLSSNQLESLLVAALGGFLAVFMQVFDDALENEQVGAAVASELDTITVVPLDRGAKHLFVFKHDSHGGMGLHLLDQVKVLGSGDLPWRGLLVYDGAVVRCAAE